jgi:hypothetical protein
MNKCCRSPVFMSPSNLEYKYSLPTGSMRRYSNSLRYRPYISPSDGVLYCVCNAKRAARAVFKGSNDVYRQYSIIQHRREQYKHLEPAKRPYISTLQYLRSSIYYKKESRIIILGMMTSSKCVPAVFDVPCPIIEVLYHSSICDHTNLARLIVSFI